VVLYNNTQQPFTFYGATFTLPPRTIGGTLTYDW
jgi:hypothetical protein